MLTGNKYEVADGRSNQSRSLAVLQGDLRSREPAGGFSRPAEEFLKLVVDGDSALSLLSLMREAAKSRAKGYEAYTRVLLDWYTHDKFWINTSGENEVSVESLLLEAVKLVTDADLRQRVEEALVARQSRIYDEKANKKSD